MSKKSRGFKAVCSLLLTGILIVGSALPVYAETENEEGNTQETAAYVPGELLVMYREDVSGSQAEEIVEEQGDDGVEIISETASGSIAVVSVSQDTSVEDAVREYAADDRVVAASPNFEMELFSDTPVNDTDYARQNYLTQTNVPQAWEIMSQTENEKVKVAVLDTGADITHPDLVNMLDLQSSREILDKNGSMGPLKGDGYQNGTYTSGGGHGTHVSGIIAAQANNGQGIAGVGSALDNSVVELISVDVFSENSRTNLAYVIKGMEYAKEAGAKIINLSLGVQYSVNKVDDSILYAQCNSLADNGIIIVCAAGNYGTDDGGKLDVIPSDYDSTISVIALNNQTKSADSCYGSLKDISAPGSAVYSTMKGGGYGAMSGTSMAAPEVTGVIAMMCSINPELGLEDVRAILHDTATDIGAEGFDIYTGAGILNAQGAVAAVADVPADGGKTGLPYGDVNKGDWYYSAVSYMYENKIMTGLEANVFGPREKVSRAQFATILYRMAQAAPVAYTERFPDVAQGKFYTDAVLWAAENGIITGYEDGKFGAEDLITREQMAVLLYRYAKYLGLDVSNTNDLSGFPDSGQVSTFAREALQWANAEKIITGNGDGTLAPGASADRAACAMMMKRFMEKY